MPLLSRNEFIKIDIYIYIGLQAIQSQTVTKMQWQFHFISIRRVTLTMLQPDAKFIYTKDQEKKIYCKYCRNPLWCLCLHSFRSHFSVMVWNIQVRFIQTSESLKDEQMIVVFSAGLCVLMTLRVRERRAAVCSEDSFFLQLEPKERGVFM